MSEKKRRPKKRHPALRKNTMLDMYYHNKDGSKASLEDVKRELLRNMNSCPGPEGRMADTKAEDNRTFLQADNGMPEGSPSEGPQDECEEIKEEDREKPPCIPAEGLETCDHTGTETGLPEEGEGRKEEPAGVSPDRDQDSPPAGETDDGRDPGAGMEGRKPFFGLLPGRGKKNSKKEVKAEDGVPAPGPDILGLPDAAKRQEEGKRPVSFDEGGVSDLAKAKSAVLYYLKERLRAHVIDSMHVTVPEKDFQEFLFAIIKCEDLKAFLTCWSGRDKLPFRIRDDAEGNRLYKCLKDEAVYFYSVGTLLGERDRYNAAPKTRDRAGGSCGNAGSQNSKKENVYEKVDRIDGHRDHIISDGLRMPGQTSR